MILLSSIWLHFLTISQSILVENKTFYNGFNLMQNNSMHKLHGDDNESSEKYFEF